MIREYLGFVAVPLMITRALSSFGIDDFLRRNTGYGIVRLHKRVNAQDTSAEPTPDLQLEIAHLLLIDVVGYSKLLEN